MKLRNLPRTTTGMAFSPAHPLPGEMITVTAWVTGEHGIPTGTVTMTAAGLPVVTGTLDAQGVVTYVTPVFGVGDYTVTAEYAGASDLLGSSAFTVAQVRMLSRVQLTMLPTVAVPGQSVVYRAKVTAVDMPTQPLTGGVRFLRSYVNPGSYVSAQLDSEGYAVYTDTAGLAGGYNWHWVLGPQVITATYEGNAAYYPVDAQATWTLSQATSVIFLTMNPITPTVGDWVVYTATAGMVEPGAYPPHGTVTFTIGSHVPVTRSYGDFPVTCTFQMTPGGWLPVKAELAEAYLYAGSQAGLTQTVLKAATALTVTGPATVTAGRPAVLVARVQPTATGVVSWSIPGQPVVTGALDASSRATGTLVLPTAGRYSVTVTYGGDESSMGSTAQQGLAVWTQLYLPLVLKSER
jgi:hypothetical protein